MLVSITRGAVYWCAFSLLLGCEGNIESIDDIETDDVSLERAALQACNTATSVSFGDPLPGLSAELSDRFDEGLDEFSEEETVAVGLGPVFNDVSCAACHFSGGIGGASDHTVTRFGSSHNGVFDPLAAQGGSLIQVNGITTGSCVQSGEVVPVEANVVTKRQTTALFGFGLLDAVPVSLLQKLEDPNDADHNGISGRLNHVTDPNTGATVVGRFGWKAQVPSVFVFAADAYVNEMGITNTTFPTESAPNGQAATCDDDIPAPALDDEDEDGNGISDGVEAFTDFMRLLAPPPRAQAGAAEARGAGVFVSARCAQCHVPALATGKVSDVPQLSRKVFFPFSDLLLHDMGALGDGIEQGQAKGSELRTAPLWGARVSAPYLHDGRAATLTEAIEAHDGEGAKARDKFKALSAQQRADLLAFLSFI